MTAHVQSLPRPSFLRQVLLLDAVTCAAMGALLLAAAGLLTTWLELPVPLLRYAGFALLPIAAFMAWVATRQPISPAGTWLVILGNWAWVAASVVLLVSGWVAPNGLGVAFVLVQAVVVAVLAVFETVGVRRA